MKLRTLLLAASAAMVAVSPAANLFAVGNGWNDGSSNFYRIDDYDTATPMAQSGMDAANP